MAKSQTTYTKQDKEKKRLKKKQDKVLKKEERKLTNDGGMDNMIAYVDEFGRITDTPPDPTRKTKVDINSIEIGVARREDVAEPTERTGKIDFFDDSKGFGFIKENNSQEKFFVHVKGLLQEVKEGDTVTFELERGLKGMNAVRVKKI
ncbi:MAG: cold shock domain-containing protein [Paludibacter sp.]|jgi:cold shock CspA family protein